MFSTSLFLLLGSLVLIGVLLVVFAALTLSRISKQAENRSMVRERLYRVCGES